MDSPTSNTHSPSQTRLLLFLSHAGIDSAAAAKLKRRIEESEAARQAGLKVWFDKDELRPGEDWQTQLEAAIAQSTAFAVLVGSGGVMNWVQAEVRLALNRANTDTSYRFIPIIATETFAEETLPGFARRYQGIANPNDPAQFQKLMVAVLGAPAPVRLEEHPFFGLRAIDESRDYLFFGREQETADLVELVGRYSLVLVSGDSGSGKSSLVRAGLVPRFRGGDCDPPGDDPQRQTIHHAVITRPSNKPWRQLGEAVERAANRMGLPLDDQGKLAAWARNDQDFNQVRQALRCQLDPEKVRVLLIVDQFEELLTLTPQNERARFVAFLLDLAVPPNPQFRVVLTMRHDYVNLITEFPALHDLLDADGRKARFVLGRMTNDGLRQIVSEPLLLAGVADRDERETLANTVLHDVGQRPGDLALVQMALTETWGLRQKYDNDLLQAYSESGRVEGALAKAAEDFLKSRTDDQRALLDNILIRLVRGQIGEATRRIATRDEFDQAEWDLLQEMASPEGKRLVVIGGGPENVTVEIAHEALVTAWPHYQEQLRKAGRDKFTLDALIPRAKAWAEEKRSTRRLATGADLEMFGALREDHRAWLSDTEAEFVKTSVHAATIRRYVDLTLRVAILASAVVLSWLYWRATEAESAAVANQRAAEIQKHAAEKEKRRAKKQQSAAEKQKLAAQDAEQKAEKEKRAAVSRARAEDALSTARRDPEIGLLKAERAFTESWTVQADRALRQLLVASLARGRITQEHSVRSAAFSPDGKRIVTVSDDKAWVWNSEESADGQTPIWSTSEKAAGEPRFLEDLSLKKQPTVRSAAFGSSRDLIMTGGSDGTALLWREHCRDQWGIIKKFPETFLPGEQRSPVEQVAFFPDGRSAATGLANGVVQIWSLEDGKQIAEHSFSKEGKITALAADPDSERERVLAVGTANAAWVWNVDSTQVTQYTDPLVNSVGLRSYAGRKYLITASDRTIRLWDAPPSDATTELPRRVIYTAERIRAAAFSPANGDAAAAMWDDTAQLWQLIDVSPLSALGGHTDSVNSIDFSPDGNLVVTASDDHTVRVWGTRAEDLTPPITTVHAEQTLGGAAFSPSGDRVVVATDWTPQIWSTTLGRRLVTRRFDDPSPQTEPFTDTGTLAGARFDAKGERIATATPRGATIWSAAEGRRLASLRTGHHSDALGVRFDRSGTRLVRWGPDRVWVWNVTDALREGANAPPAPQPIPFESRVLAVAFATTGASVIVASESELSIWDRGEDSAWKKVSATQIEPKATEASFNCAGDSGRRDCDATMVVIVGGGNANVWQLGGDGVSWKNRLTHPATHAALSSDGSLLAALEPPETETGTVEDGGWIVSLATGKHVGDRINILWGEGPSDEPREMVAAAFSPDDALLATAWNNGAVTVWGAREGHDAAKRITTIKDELTAIEKPTEVGIAFSPDARFLLCWNVKNARIYRRERFAPRAEILQLVDQRVSEQAKHDYGTQTSADDETESGAEAQEDERS